MMQRGHDDRLRPVVYGSRILNSAERTYSTTDKELLAVVYAITNLREYTYGQKIKVVSDHAAIKHLINMPVPRSNRHCNYLSKIRDVDITFEFTKGKNNTVPDGLSRNLDVPEEFTKEGNVSVEDILRDEADCLNIEGTDMRSQLKDAYQSDKLLLPVYERALMSEYKSSGHFYVQNHVMYYKPDRVSRMVVPRSFIAKILSVYHDTNYNGHPGEARMNDRLKKRFYWSTMDKDIKLYVQSCKPCAEFKSLNRAQAGLTMPTPVYGPFEHLYLDAIGPWKSSGTRQSKYIIVAFCSVTRFVIAESVRSVTAKAIANFIINSIVFVHGCPRQINFDQAAYNRAELMTEITKALGIKMRFSLAYSHGGNSCVEAANKQIERLLSFYVEKSADDWAAHLKPAVFALNSSKHSGLQVSPFFLVYGREPVLPADIVFPLANNEANRHLEHAQQARELVKFLLIHSQDQAARFRDKSRLNLEFTPGQLVYVAFPNLGAPNTPKKLSRKYSGPFKVINKGDNANTYILLRLGVPKAQPIKVHVERLKAFLERPDRLVDTGSVVQADPTPSSSTQVDSGSTVIRTRSGRQVKPPIRLNL